MSEVKLFRDIDKTACEIPSGPFPVEKSLQVVLQENLAAMLGVRFLASRWEVYSVSIHAPREGERLPGAIVAC